MIATFGGGCFWGVEEDFHHIDGILKTEVGYMGGNLKNPTYEDVCNKNTGHVEVVNITYNDNKVTYNQLLNKFFEIHDPTQINMQAPDVGEQYRSVIFYHNDDQKIQAENKIEELNKSSKFNENVATKVEKATQFYKAEEYHQQYLHKRGQTSCRFISKI